MDILKNENTNEDEKLDDLKLIEHEDELLYKFKNIISTAHITFNIMIKKYKTVL